MITDNRIKLVAVDMDGTLLNSNKEVPKDFYDWVIEHPEIKTVVASGRQYQTLERDFYKIKENLIFVTENGSAVYEDGKVIYKDVIDDNDVLKCIELIEKFQDIVIVLCGINSAYTLRKEDEDFCENGAIYFEKLQYVDELNDLIGKDEFVEIALYVKDFGSQKVYDKLKENIPERIKIVLSGDSWLDIENEDVNKGSAIHAIQQKYGIKADESMAFGDYLNDYEMFLACTESYCMENGRNELKKISKYIAESNDNDGVMKILRTIK